MAEQQVMIDIQNVSKKYLIGQINGTTLEHELQSWWARKRGHEDPNTKVGSDPNRRGSSFYALQNINLKIRKGEAIGIIGKNGAGKSTLLKLISQVTYPTEGCIDVCGRVTTMLEIGTGFDPELTGRENIYFNGSLNGMSKKEIDRKMDDIIAFSELEEFIDTPIKRYSSGMFAKLGFAVAANVDGEIMIVDEVLAVGDYRFQNKCIQTMADFSRLKGKTVLCVSHNMQHIRQLCSRCVVLQEGRIIFDGDTETAISLYLDQAIRDDIKLDYAGYKRPDWLKDQPLFALDAEFLDCQTNTFSNKDKPRVRVRAEADRPIQGVSLRIEVQNTFNTNIGTYILYDITDMVPDKVYDIVFDYPADLLISGLYNVIYCFFVRDKLGNNQNIENVPGLSFRIERERSAEEVQWDRKSWGDVVFDGARVISVTHS